jgi:hypothetical protein
MKSVPEEGNEDNGENINKLFTREPCKQYQ